MADPVDLTVEMYLGGVWTDISADVRKQEGQESVSIVRGRTNEQGRVSPTQVQFSLTDPDGRYNDDNPSSPYYRQLGRATPVRVSVGADVRATVETVSWRPEWDVTGRAVEVAVEAAGIMRRLDPAEGQTPLRAPLYRAITAASPGPAGYWPLDDGRDATQAGSGLTGGVALPVIAGTPSWSVVDGPGGAPAPVLELVATAGGTAYTGAILGDVPGISATGWAVDLWFQATVPAGGAAGNVVLAQWETGGTYSGRWSLHAAQSGISGTQGIVLLSDVDARSETGIAVLDGRWHHVRVTGHQDNATQFTTVMYWDGVAVDTYAWSPYTLGALRRIEVGDYRGLVTATVTGGSGSLFGVDSAAVSSLVVWDGSAPALAAADAYLAGTGYAGETAADRIDRLCGEEGIPFTLVGTAADTATVGPQQTDTLLELLQQGELVDQGVLYEPRDAIGLTYRTGVSLYNQAPALDLDYDDGHLSPPFRPASDDRRLVNDVTASRPDGSSARYTIPDDDPYHYTTQDPQDSPDGVGQRADAPTFACETDEQLSALAAWSAHVGAWREPRFPQVKVNLRAPAYTVNPTLTADVTGADLGDVISIDTTGTLGWLPPDDVLLMVQGTVERLSPVMREIGWNTVPARPYEVGVVGEAAGTTVLRGQAVDTDASTLAGGITITGTTLSVASTGVLWTTDSADWSTSLYGAGPSGTGLYLQIGGEIMRVTNITGAASPQTFTVVRSINGVIKAHLSGTAVHVAYPVVVGL